MNPQELLQVVRDDSLYQQWSRQHPQAYLSHFFCQVDNQFREKSDWDAGFYEPSSNKITVFSLQTTAANKQAVIIKPADDIFQKEPAAIERLEMEKVNVRMEEAINSARQALQENFPGETLGDGFLILQVVQGKTLWNFAFITKALRFVNVKIDAQTGEEYSHEQVDLVRK